MNDFDWRLESELARMLDRVVRAPAPPRRGGGERPLLKLYSGSEAAIAPVATVVVLVEAPTMADSIPVAGPVVTPATALFS